MGRGVEGGGGVGLALVRMTVLLIVLEKFMWLIIWVILFCVCARVGGWLLLAPMPASALALLVCLLCVPGGEK